MWLTQEAELERECEWCGWPYCHCEVGICIVVGVVAISPFNSKLNSQVEEGERKCVHGTQEDRPSNDFCLTRHGFLIFMR
jgi:hypothetical protein